MGFLPTHYTYMFFGRHRQPVDWFDLDGVGVKERREFIGTLLTDVGTPLAKMPKGFVTSLDELERVINKGHDDETLP